MQATINSTNSIGQKIRPAVEQVRMGHDKTLTDIMRSHNQRMFRIARSVLRNDADAEDIVQDAFIKAFTHLDTVESESNIGAWLARITVNLALSRLRQKKRRERIVPMNHLKDCNDPGDVRAHAEADQLTPERLAAMSDIRFLLEQEIDKLADGFREVFVLREVEQMTTAECALALDIPPETVKTRLHRAKTKLRQGLQDHFTAVSLRAFPFGGKRCERTTRAVLEKLRMSN